MLTDAQRAEGWVEHDGGECPVPKRTTVAVLFRGHKGLVLSLGGPRRYAENLRWTFAPLAPSSDIIAYRKEPT